MTFTIDDVYSDIEFTFADVSDWAIYARAKDSMIAHPDWTEDEAIKCAIEDEHYDFEYNMRKIKHYEFNKVDAVTLHDDDTFTVDDDFYTDEHAEQITEFLASALKECREDTYAEEVDFAWYHR